MDLVVATILVISFTLSTYATFRVRKAKAGKRVGRFVAFSSHVVILSMGTIVLYQMDAQAFHKQSVGLFESLGIVVLVFFIPVLTFGTLAVVESRMAFTKRKQNESS